MIYTSDNQVYEDATAHALDMPKDLSQTAFKMPVERSAEPAGALKSDLGTQIAEKPSESKTLYIIRHGATDMNNESNVSTDRIRGWTDIPLNDEGRQDAEKAGQKLASMETPTVMHHSDLDRAAETAEIIGKHVDVPTTASRKLRPWDLGTLTGKSTEEAIPQIEDYVKNKPDVAVPKGESFNEFKQRAFEGIHTALNSGDSPVAIVTHHRLERLLEAWDAKGQPADHSIDLDTFVQKGDPPGGIKTMKIAANDIPEISGGLRQPPKPANDNDPRKPFKEEPSGFEAVAQQKDYDELANLLRTSPEVSPPWALMQKGIPMPKVSDLRDVPPSTNIVHRDRQPTAAEDAFDTFQSFQDSKRLSEETRDIDKTQIGRDIGVLDLQKFLNAGAIRSLNRKTAKEAEFKKHWKTVK